jgi:hypothetical protein
MLLGSTPRASRFEKYLSAVTVNGVLPKIGSTVVFCIGAVLELFLVESHVPVVLCFHGIGANGNPLLRVVKVLGTLGMLFLLAAPDATVGFDFAVRIKGSPAVTPTAPCELDVLVQREFGQSHKNLRAG